MTVKSDTRVESMISKVFCVTSSPTVVDQLRTFASSQGAFVVPDLQLEKLMDDDFIAGFCTKGEVTILPLVEYSDLTFDVQKSVLTLRMSPTVYAGFGLAASKVKTGLRRFHYRYRVDLRHPHFLRNGSLHQRLRAFLSSHSDPTTALTVPRFLLQPTACFVHWIPNSGEQTGVPPTDLPNPASLARYLGPDSYCWIQPRLEMISQPLSLPEIYPSVSTASTNDPNPDPGQTQSDGVDADKARGAFHLLSLLATGLGHPSMETDLQTESSGNPCLTNPHLAPILSMRLLEAGPLNWSFPESVVVRIHGLFTGAQIEQLEQTVRACITHQPQRSFAFLATGLLKAEQPSTDPAVVFRPRASSKPAGSLFLWEPMAGNSMNLSNNSLVIRFDAT